LPFRLARVPARMAQQDACMEEMFIAIGLYQVRFPHREALAASIARPFQLARASGPR